MKINRVFSQNIFLPSASTRLILSLLLSATLVASLWMATAPAARARVTTPVDLIQAGLPPGKTVTTATKPEFLSALCGAVKEHRPIAPEITRTAVSAHREYAGDIVATVLRCSPDVDCPFVGRIVRAAIVNAPSEASLIQDEALAVQPDCANAIQGATPDGKEVLDGKEMLDGKEVLPPPVEGPGGLFGPGTVNQAPLPGSVGGGGGGFNPQDQLIMVCDNGTQRTVRESLLNAFLAAHPGAFVGSCQPTPTTNR